jgi:PAS domain S-box-containing protein
MKIEKHSKGSMKEQHRHKKHVTRRKSETPRNTLEHPHTTAALPESDARYRLLFENANDMIATFTLEGIITSVNRGLEVALGWSREELIGQHYCKLATPAALTLANERTRRALAGETLPSIFEAEILRKDGTVVPIEVRSRFLRDRTGQPIGVQGIFRDLTVRKQAEAAVQENYRFLQQIADTLPAIIYLYDVAEHRTLYVNRQLLTVLGYTPAALQKMRDTLLRTLLHPEDWEVFAAVHERFVDTQEGGSIEIQYRLKHATGEWRWVDSRETIFARTAEGQPTQILGIAHELPSRTGVEELSQEPGTDLPSVADNLRLFRDSVGLTQAAFGQTFGGYTQRQISSYESGEVEVPLRLLLEIRRRGYPLEVVLGPSGSTLTRDAVLQYVLTTRHTQNRAKQLAEALMQVVQQEGETMGHLIRQLRRPPGVPGRSSRLPLTHLTKGEYKEEG